MHHWHPHHIRHIDRETLTLWVLGGIYIASVTIVGVVSVT
jgi:hypothetical protein